ncbi:hypothetical protein FMUND_4852 [Fusarium mundagurra]|uniref:Uncharacterized protein n=1 Tax=Fusarium mundagurra TaxID=1567541 RepID=A0A8H5YUF7_9HYPO|nr:hypothetical protein FMUND_4852 [Fusarium mundagurra]
MDKTSFEAFYKMDLRKYGPETENPAIKRLWRSHKNEKQVVLFSPPTQCAGLKIKGTPEVMSYALFRRRLVHEAKNNGTFPPWFPGDPKIQYYFDAAKRLVTIDCSWDKSPEDPLGAMERAQIERVDPAKLGLAKSEFKSDRYAIEMIDDIELQFIIQQHIDVHTLLSRSQRRVNLA